ncbi:hypothetical protein IGI53_002208 [Enterococcus sp. DIV0788_1]
MGMKGGLVRLDTLKDNIKNLVLENEILFIH